MLCLVVVDDNPVEIYLLKEALQQVSAEFTLHTFQSGDTASRYFRSAVQNHPAKRPHIILLDINLPGKSGLELLDQIKNDERLRTIPVIMVSTSANPRDVQQAYASHASCYLVKRMDADAHIDALQRLLTFWSLTARLPKQVHAPVPAASIGTVDSS
ncbi:MAG: response regulator [Acidobacteriota bacterium]|nr:response regulator [Acidobacteriota bacterium]